MVHRIKILLVWSTNGGSGTVKSVLCGYLKKTKQRSMTDGSLMKVESIAEPLELSAILLTCIKQLSDLKTNFALLFQWPLKTGFTENHISISK